jgi:hypothetical protein
VGGHGLCRLDKVLANPGKRLRDFVTAPALDARIAMLRDQFLPQVHCDPVGLYEQLTFPVCRDSSVPE